MAQSNQQTANRSKKAQPNASEFGRFRAYLAKLGIKQAEINAAVGSNVNGRKWEQIGDQLRDWISQR